MRYGINVPNFGDYFHPNTLSELAVEAEKAGWDGFFVWDHLTGYGAVCDTTIALAAIASRTEHIRFGAMITPLPRRRPWKVAREMISLDHLSNGRLVVGVGLGNPPSEFESFGEDVNVKVRAQKLDDGLNILLGLWSGELFSYCSAHYQLDGVEYIPRPVQRPRIPIWVGGFWPNKKPIRRAARYDGVYPARIWPEQLTVDDLREVLSYVRRHRTSSGPFDVVVGGQTPSDSTEGNEEVEPWMEAGATWWSENINGWRGSLKEMKKRIVAGPPE